jgi:hypothetical protein
MSTLRIYSFTLPFSYRLSNTYQSAKSCPNYYRVETNQTFAFLQVLRKLAKKHRLTKGKREKTVMYIEDLAGVLQTNLTTTKKYTHRQHRI